MVESTFSVSVFCVVSAILVVILKQYVREHAFFISIIVCVLVLGELFNIILPLIDDIRSIFIESGLPEDYLSIIFKAISICLITQLTSDLCKDSGENAIASVAEMWGRGTVAYLSLPLIKALITRITEML